MWTGNPRMPALWLQRAILVPNRFGYRLARQYNAFHTMTKKQHMTWLSSPSDYSSFVSKFDTFLVDCDGSRFPSPTER